MKAVRKFLAFPSLPIWLAPFLLLAPVYLTGKALFWGTPLLQFIPWWSYAWQTLLSGHLPLWNPLVGMGAPLLANYQSALFYPPNWLYLLLYSLAGVQAMAWGMALVAAAHLALAGLGMAGLVRRLGLSALAQAVSGLAFGLSGYLVARLGFLSITSTIAWLPWVLLCLTPHTGESALKRKDFLKLTCFLVLLLLAGHAQTAWYTLLLAGLWAGFWACISPGWMSRVSQPVQAQPPRRAWQERIKQLLKAWGWLVLALLLAAGICAAQLLPTAEYLLQSQRAGAVDYDFALNYSFWPWHLLTLLAPGLFGSPVTGDYWGYANYWEDAIYVGLLPLLLAVGVVLNNLRPQPTGKGFQHSLVWFLCAIITLALALALGKNTPLFPWLYRHIPTFDMFQAPARWMIWVEFALALLAGFGIERWRRPLGWGLYWTRLGTMGAFAVTIGAGLAWYSQGEISPSFIRSAAAMGFFGVGVGALALTAPPPLSDSPGGLPDLAPKAPKTLRKRLFQFSPPAPRPPSPDKPYRLELWQAAVIAFLALDLLAAGWGLNPSAPLEIYAPSPLAFQTRELTQGARIYLSQEQEYSLKYIRFLRFDTYHIGEDWLNLRAVLLPNTHLLDNIASTNNFDPLLPGRYADWVEMLNVASPTVQEQLLRLMGVGMVEGLNKNQQYGVQFQHLDGRWMRWVYCARLVSDPMQARRLLLGGELNFDQEVILEGTSALPMDDCPASAMANELSAPQQVEIRDGRSDPNHIEIHLVAPDSGWLVLSDVWYPGWRAWVDGSPVELLRANYLFRALRVPLGERHIVLAYQPLSFWGGVALSGLSILVACWFFFRLRSGSDN